MNYNYKANCNMADRERQPTPSESEREPSDKKSKAFLDHLIGWYSYYLQTHPVLTKSLTSSITSGLGQLIAQIAARRTTGQDINCRTIAAFSTFGFVITGPLIHYLYQYLEYIVPKGATYGKAKKLAIDRLIFAPPFLLLFFYVVSILEGKSSKEAVERIRNNYWAALKMSLKVWTVIQYINFSYVPYQYRMLFANAMSLCWNVYLASKNTSSGK